MSDKPKLKIMSTSDLPVDEQKLLTAYRAMSDETRIDTLEFALFNAERWPRLGGREPLRLIVGGMA